MRDLRFACHQLLKNPGFTVMAVASLAVGLALAATTFAMVNAYLWRSVPYPTAQRVFHVMYAPPGPYEPRGMTAIDWTELNDVVEDTITPASAAFYVMDGGGARTLRGLEVPPGFVRGLGVRPSLGRLFTPDEYASGGESVAVIGHTLWRDRFGSDPQVVGRTLQVNRDELAEQSDTLRVVGVLPPGFWFGRDSSATVDVITPLRSRVGTYMVRLRDGVPVADAERRITEAARAVGSDFRPGWPGVKLESVHDRYVADIRPILVGVSAAVGVVLVLVCANLGVLTLLRSAQRQREVAVRAALGAGRWPVLRLFLVENLLLCGIALVAGLGLTGMTLSVLTPMVEQQFGRPSPAGPSVVRLDLTVIGVVAVCGLLIALSLALLPWLTPWRCRLADALRSSGTAWTEGRLMRRLRSSMIAFEVAGSVVLLAGCGLMLRSAVNLVNTDLGFDPKQVIRVGIRLPARTYGETPALDRFFTTLMERLPQVRGSQLTLMSAFPSYYPANTAAWEAEGAASGQVPVGLMRVGAGYFDLYGVRIREGREFSASDRQGSEPVAVISQSLATQLWPKESAVGRQIRVVEGDMPGAPLGSWRTIVGVVGDIRQGYEDTELRDIYVPFSQVPGRFASIHVRTPKATLFWEQTIRAAASEVEPFVQVSAARTIESEDRQGRGARFLTSMLSGFAVFAALLAALGIYGVTAYVVAQREREIGIRMAIGASRANLVRQFLKEGACTLATGLGCGLIGTFAVARLLQGVIYGVQPFDAVTLLFASGLMGAVGLLAIWRPAQRGATRDPLRALRGE
ncbi:MAG: ABC transporter permease [Verrucomicrobiales bacterium]|nr:ABC transporter permease [Verrucomicrobiales bacterium]